MITRLFAALLLVAVVGAACGCGTIYSQRDYWNPQGKELILVLDGVWVYVGTLNDINLLGQLYGLTLIDLPLSLAADTALLTMTIPDSPADRRPAGVCRSARERGRTSEGEQAKDRDGSES